MATVEMGSAKAPSREMGGSLETRSEKRGEMEWRRSIKE